MTEAHAYARGLESDQRMVRFGEVGCKGQRGSGIGREFGREGLEAFQETKHVHIDPKVERKEW